MLPDPTRLTRSRLLILLDVDGVINDTVSARGGRRPWFEHRLTVDGEPVHIPEHVPHLVQYLDLIGEIVWCSTWGDRANVHLPEVLGVGPFPVLPPDEERPMPGWKARSAAGRASRALDAGRRVLWIEDFEGEVPDDVMPAGTEFIDTAAHGEYVLLPEHLPLDLRPKRYGDR